MRSLCPFLLLFSIVGACEAGGDAVTYRAQVQPILARHCVGCHSSGAIAPFTLDTYDTASRLAGPIAAAARARTMPPYPVDNSGACNRHLDARWLSEGEIATLEAWAQGGAPEGDGAIPAAPPAEPPRLQGDVRTVTMRVSYVPDTTQADDYRCFLVDAPDAAPSYYVTGFDVRPGEARIVHHVIVFAPRDEGAVAAARALEAADGRPGYGCFGAAGVPAAAVAAWAPGGGATSYPSATAVKLTGGRPLIVQVHYNILAGSGLSDRTSVDLAIVHDGVAQGRYLPLAQADFSLPPRMASISVETTVDLAALGKLPVPVRVLGVYPHMHTLGQTLQAEIVHPDGSQSCITTVPRWDFHWQMLYFFTDPPRLSPGDKLHLRCTYDTRSRDQITHFGEGTADEMCIAALYVAL